MTDLSASEIEDLLNLVGSDCIVAIAARAETRVSPRAWWVRGNDEQKPTTDEYARLVVLRDIMELFAKNVGAGNARDLLVNNLHILEALRLNSFDLARREAHAVLKLGWR